MKPYQWAAAAVFLLVMAGLSVWLWIQLIKWGASL